MLTLGADLSGGNVDGRMGRSRGECEDDERIVGSGYGQCSLRSITVPMTRYGSRCDSRSVDARSAGGERDVGGCDER